MRSVLWITAVVATAAVGPAHAGKLYFGNRAPAPPPKHDRPSPPKSSLPVIRQGGETFGSAVVIPSLPYADNGNTCNNIDDYYPDCAFLGNSDAPDVVYSFTPQAEVCVDASLCGSGFDTVLHVYAADAAHPVACNDDDVSGDCELQSVIPSLHLNAGITYYFVVDGWSTSCGDYTLQIRECPPPCVVACPAGAGLEGEPDCSDGYDDRFNGGCNSQPPVFSNLACNDTAAVRVCGTFGTFVFQNDNFRDTDWYKIETSNGLSLDLCVSSEAPSLIAILDGTNGCPVVGDPPILCFGFGDECEPACCSANVPPGIYWLFVSTSDFTGVPCGTDYVLSVDGNLCGTVGAQPVEWSGVKQLYR
jgi:hypothetical protein